MRNGMPIPGVDNLYKWQLWTKDWHCINLEKIKKIYVFFMQNDLSIPGADNLLINDNKHDYRLKTKVI